MNPMRAIAPSPIYFAYCTLLRLLLRRFQSQPQIQRQQGAFQQSEKRAESDSFFVICDSSVNPQTEIDAGRVNVVVGFAPLKPAEFVVITITQISQAGE